MSMKKILIAIPAHRDDKCFNFALSSALAQNEDIAKIIVIDNNINRVNEIYFYNNKNFNYIKNDSNIGSLANFVKCWKFSNEKYFVWLGDDDFLAPDFADLALREIESTKSRVVAWSGIPTSFNSIKGVNKIGYYHPNISHDDSLIRIMQCMRFGKYNYPFYSIYNRDYLSIDPLEALVDWPVPCDGIDWAWSYYISFVGEIRNIDSQLYFYRSENWLDSSQLENLKSYYVKNIIKYKYIEDDRLIDVAVRINRLISFMVVMLIGLKQITNSEASCQKNYTKMIKNIFWIFYDNIILRRDWPSKVDYTANYINTEIMKRGGYINTIQLLNILIGMHDELVNKDNAILENFTEVLEKNLSIKLRLELINEEATKINIYIKIILTKCYKYYALTVTLLNINFLRNSFVNLKSK
jgi:hypothetical protein